MSERPNPSALILLDDHSRPPPASSPSSSTLARDYNKGNWTVHETLILITAKRLDDERRASGDRPFGDGRAANQRPSEQRWKWVENHCWRYGCQRSQNQCNDKWDNLLREYKKVRGYEARGDPAAGRPSYWSMERHERKERNLPTNLAPEVFDALTDVLSRRSSRRGASAPLPSRPFLPPPLEQQQADAPPPPPPPPPPRTEQRSVSAELVSESSDDTDEDGDNGAEPETKRRKSRGLGRGVARGASVLARALLACEEKRERRHRDLLELEERRLRMEADRTEMGRQGIAGLITAVVDLSGAIRALASSDHHQHHHRNPDAK